MSSTIEKKKFEKLRFEIESLTPRIYANHLDTSEGKMIQGDYNVGFTEMQKKALFLIDSMDETEGSDVVERVQEGWKDLFRWQVRKLSHPVKLENESPLFYKKKVQGFELAIKKVLKII